ncbi:hypothetical protein [Falsarthrobacter nasiphocae]|uniref:Uncharacterized protein n=1 Tax=Falsarthrobacter nasiphocae TaxID=189863 RepID=A0AAE3YH16_9MICC|nr:hypothetical protein [Falsarthrobacter nasiphocae]MDR6891851.1 hypothetical protein [Falsarthrobacter nasiphocae]
MSTSRKILATAVILATVVLTRCVENVSSNITLALTIVALGLILAPSRKTGYRKPRQ